MAGISGFNQFAVAPEQPRPVPDDLFLTETIKRQVARDNTVVPVAPVAARG